MRVRSALFLLAALSVVSGVAAQDFPGEAPVVHVKWGAEPATVAPGQTVEVFADPGLSPERDEQLAIQTGTHELAAKELAEAQA